MIRDLSLARRLALGFGCIIVVFTLLLLLVQREQGVSVRAQERLTGEVLPRDALAMELERAVLYVGIGVRAYLLAPSPQARAGLDRQSDAARAIEERLDRFPKEGQGAARYRDVGSNVRAYVSLADSLAEAEPTYSTAIEQRLTTVRERALTALRAYSALQHRQRDSRLAALAEARTRVSRSLLTALIVGLAIAMAAATLTSRSLDRAIARLIALANAFERGDWAQVATLGDTSPGGTGRTAGGGVSEFTRVSHAFRHAGDAIVVREQELVARTRVATAAASSLDVDEIATHGLRMVAEHVGADVGVLHVRRPAGEFVAIARHALTAADAFHAGDGIAGRAAAEQRTVVLHHVPADTPFQLRVGFDRAPVSSVVSVPLLVGGEARGVLTLGALRPLDARAIGFLEAAALQLSVGLENARTHADVQALLARVSGQRAHIQEQVEQLQAQHEELQAQYEEIQAQSEEIQAQNEELQAQSEEIQLQNARLQDQSSALTLADDRKNHFLAMLAHELRNPLSAVTSCTHLLLADSALAPPTRKAGTIIDRQVRQLTRLIDDLLDVTRIVHGKLLIEPAPVDVAALLVDVVDDHRLLIDRQKLTLDLVLPETPVMMMGDQVRMTQMIGNLLDNAIKFTEPGGSVRVSAQANETAITIAVTDSGIGIRQDILPQLFQPFVQANAALTRHTGGLGLGLSIVRAIAEMHGGTVAASSDGNDRGTTMTVTLPLRPNGGGAQAGAFLRLADTRREPMADGVSGWPMPSEGPTRTVTTSSASRIPPAGVGHTALVDDEPVCD